MTINFVSEIGINHNGSLQMCKEMMMLSKIAGANFVKIQKRNPDICVPENQKHKMKNTPWGDMTYLQYKHRIEFDENQIKELFDYGCEIGIELFASVWDKDSADLMKKYTNICKIPSALITDIELCEYVRKLFDFVIISTGMSTEDEIYNCVQCCTPNVIMHTNSTYPCPVEDLNLRYIEWLKNKYPDTAIGYSGHEVELCTTSATVLLGVTWIEKHITLSNSLWGSDQQSSIEPIHLIQLIKDIRLLENAIKYEPRERIQFSQENIKKESLRK